MIIQPVIKWSGSKRKQADKIVAMMPSEIENYYEPFCGGGSVFIKLAFSGKSVRNFIISDLNNDLINLWNQIKNNPNSVYTEYKKMWHEMNTISDWQEKKGYFVKIRNRFNKEKSPFDFMFIMRTTFNGMPRYNKNGDFNNPLHPNRNGIIPEKLQEILKIWSKVLNQPNVIFLNQSYEKVSTQKNDFMYLDPPYAGIKGMYYGCLDDYDVLWQFLRNQKGKWALSFDGKTTSEDYLIKIPEDLYKSHEFLENGNSSFRRLNGKSNKEYVFESLYKNY